MSRRMLRALGVITFLLAVAHADADVKMHVLFKSHMVLQRDMKTPVWGTAAPGEKVTVKIAGQTVTAAADAEGAWQVRLAPMKAGGPHRMTVAANGKDQVWLTDVLVGDVWLCGGQSNMSMAVYSSKDAKKEMASANYEQIRFLRMPRGDADVPQKSLPWAVWWKCTPKSAGSFSAVGYFFGRRLHNELKVPIGLIMCEWGGTAAEAWTGMDALKREPAFRQMLAGWDAHIKAVTPEAKAAYEKAYAAYRKARADGKRASRPKKPKGLSVNRPAALYNFMVHPLMPYGLKGVIWYQGEDNAWNDARALQYRKLLPTLIACWRDGWGQGDFPFLIVQLANYMAVKPQPSDSSWALCREAQAMTAKNVPNCGLAVAIDCGEAKNIHPKNKQDVGTRLALTALARVYGRDVVYSGPVYLAMKVQGATVRISFKHIGGGIIIKGGEPLKGFAVAGADKKFVWADAKIDGDAVVLSAKDVPKPVAVRYAWANNPVCNLYNKDGLPAVPFRTDDW